MLEGISNRFECVVKGSNEKLTVLDFECDVTLSKLYVCKIECISLNPDLDYLSFVDKSATLVIEQKDTSTQYINGVVTEFVQKGKVGKGYAYAMTLEPRLSQMKHQEQTEVYLNMSVPEVVEQNLREAKIQFRNDLSQDYLPRPFICQFQEVDFDFICRWLEHEGIYYYFEQGVDSETLILTDRRTTHTNHPHSPVLKYNQENITEISGSTNVINNFTSSFSKVAKTLELKGYNYDDDTLPIITDAIVSENGMGKVEIFDEIVVDQKDAHRIAEVRAQEISCKEKIYTGTTLSSNVIPGYRFKLENHFRGANNQEYLVFDVHQSGSQRQLVLSHFGLQNQSNGNQQDEKVVFMTEFKAIPGNIQFRAPSVTPIKRINGIIPAILDAETSGEYAQLDEQGRYKFRLIHSEKVAGNASDWVRKMESYIGNDYGSHFPLHKDTEVCISFQFGNPDRPIIMGAVHNSSNKNVVTSVNQKSSMIKSASGNQIVMGDQSGQEYMKMATPNNDAMVLFGNINVVTV
ncbi:type VI secretion system tip protein VgrG [Francisellaceae bacterium]|nr:type VI secretion system tip protein VgrG [Francisellaceae bacterium]